jgi:TonB family protein
VAIAGIADLDFADGGGGSGGGSAGAAGTAGRSNDSLLATVRRYAPGIQFCYENELKKNAGLRGKLVVSLTVLADGSVSDVVVVENTLGSDAVVGCALAQMEGWQFASIAGGVSTFKAPFVFTPPDS